MNTMTEVRIKPAPGWMTIEPDEDFITHDDRFASQADELVLPPELEGMIPDSQVEEIRGKLRELMTRRWCRAKVIEVGPADSNEPHTMPWGPGDYVYYPDKHGQRVGKITLMQRGTPAGWSNDA